MNVILDTTLLEATTANPAATTQDTTKDLRMAEAGDITILQTQDIHNKVLHKEDLILQIQSNKKSYKQLNAFTIRRLITIFFRFFQGSHEQGQYDPSDPRYHQSGHSGSSQYDPSDPRYFQESGRDQHGSGQAGHYDPSDPRYQQGSGHGGSESSSFQHGQFDPSDPRFSQQGKRNIA